MIPAPTWFSGYIGAPYLEGGSDIETGIDCYHLARVVLRDRYGIEVSPGYDVSDWREVPVGGVEPGDIILFRMPLGKTHVGVYIGGRSMIHAGPAGVEISDLSAGRWRQRTTMAYRHKSRYSD